ncbi:MAG: hypothetical protein U0O44_01895 [Eggerthellaceae bacterium]
MLAKEYARLFPTEAPIAHATSKAHGRYFQINGLNFATYIVGISKPKLHGLGAPTGFTHQPNRVNTNYRNIITELDIGDFGPVKPRRHHVAHHSGST